MLELDKKIMKKMITDSESQLLKKAELRKKKEKNYNISIFSIEINNETELLNNWEVINREIAFHYQNKILELDIEIWNVYLIFICNEKISNTTKYLIENNKLSSRKIIIVKDNDFINTDNMINEKLFKINLSKKEYIFEEKVNLTSVIDNVNPNLHKYLDYDKANVQFQILLEELS